MSDTNPTVTETERREEIPEEQPLSRAKAREYWRKNVRLIAVLMTIWFLVSFVAAILLAEPLTNVYIGEIPVSFWFAQQGAIITFVLLIFIYIWRMNKLDREYGVED